MNTNAAVKYFKLFREAHNMDDSDYVTNGEVLMWLTDKLEREAEVRSPKAVAARHQKSLDLLDKFVKENPEEVKALIEKHRPKHVFGLSDYDIEQNLLEQRTERRRNNIGVHQTHCCKGHGCKYGDKDCPVVLGEVEGVSACEFDEPDSPCSGEPTVSYLAQQLKDCIIEHFLSDKDKLDSPYMIIGNKVYTRQHIAENLRLETTFGVGFMKDLLNLTIEKFTKK